MNESRNVEKQQFRRCVWHATRLCSAGTCHMRNKQTNATFNRQTNNTNNASMPHQTSVSRVSNTEAEPDLDQTARLLNAVESCCKQCAQQVAHTQTHMRIYTSLYISWLQYKRLVVCHLPVVSALPPLVA